MSAVRTVGIVFGSSVASDPPAIAGSAAVISSLAPNCDDVISDVTPDHLLEVTYFV